MAHFGLGVLEHFGSIEPDKKNSAHGQYKNSQVTSQASASQLIPLDRSVASTLDMLDCQMIRSLDH